MNATRAIALWESVATIDALNTEQVVEIIDTLAARAATLERQNAALRGALNACQKLARAALETK